MRPHRFALLVLGLCLSSPAPVVRADHIEWFNPIAAKVSGPVTVGAAPATHALHFSSGALPTFGTVSIPLGVRSDVVIDSVYVFYKTTPGDVGASNISATVVRQMSLPTGTTTLYADMTTRQNHAGGVYAVDVADVAPYGAPELVISFSLASQTYVEIGAIGLAVNGPAALGVRDDPASPSSLQLAPNHPEPFTPPTTFEYTLATAEHVQVRVFDATGRAVRSLVDRTLPPGRYVETWDGRDEAGRRLAPGVYYARVSNGRETRAERMIMLR